MFYVNFFISICLDIKASSFVEVYRVAQGGVVPWLVGLTRSTSNMHSRMY